MPSDIEFQNRTLRKMVQGFLMRKLVPGDFCGIALLSPKDFRLYVESEADRAGVSFDEMRDLLVSILETAFEEMIGGSK